MSDKSAKKGQTVDIKVVGWFLNGTAYFSRQKYRINKAGVGEEIKCLDEGVMNINLGMEALCICTGDHAYTSKGHPFVRKTTVMLFDVQHLSV